MLNPSGRATASEAISAVTVVPMLAPSVIGYALCSAAFAAAVVFGAVVGPVFVFDLPEGARRALVGGGATVAAVLFVVRVVSVLVRFRPSAQPSQPGRTSPDS